MSPRQPSNVNAKQSLESPRLYRASAIDMPSLLRESGADATATHISTHTSKNHQAIYFVIFHASFRRRPA